MSSVAVFGGELPAVVPDHQVLTLHSSYGAQTAVGGDARPRLHAKGFVFMDTPAFDPISATGQVGGGANIVCFTTGRGPAYGCVHAPSLKLATNTLSKRQQDDMDINCGEIIDGTASTEERGPQRIAILVPCVHGTTTTRSRDQRA